jgi:cation diffusion facilitator family transporter
LSVDGNKRPPLFSRSSGDIDIDKGHLARLYLLVTRTSVLRRAALVVLGVNLALVTGKGLVWWWTGSLAVGSEAINSLTDVLYSAIVVGGLYLTTRPPDPDHPHGHERIEPFVSLVVAVGVFGAGVAVLWRAGTTILGPSDPVGGAWTAIAVLAASAGAKLWLYRYCRRIAREVGSPALVASAEDNRADVVTALAALVGVAGAGAGYPILDPLAAGVVGVGILYAAVTIVRDNLNYLIGAAPPEDLRHEILQRAMDHSDVEGAHDVVAHYVGPEIDVSLNVEVEGDITLREAHGIETAIVDSIRELEDVDDVYVHVDPKELGEWKTDDDQTTLGRDDC